ncbi:BLUF domain-containing protein [Arenibacter sp. M-2]|uniref:BLUF domain-containing protein n=1 Tax=unclassified Arenibacter TaxID=2615047 RepID=UPI000D750DF8|nr:MULTISPECIES: BLUF domain-containing protein [unclassified Arenibacter]MDL5513176.1 BLUF domain-containing protein [Arenibacter sp. M-2]PXX28962.1 FAD-dependent sensor of blue light [Arenibacter sp. ARW7G5Y1]|tara:strand:- start:7104 stop:7535 length:432 start_codon:yes stop_codon:yes gene_type:complete
MYQLSYSSRATQEICEEVISGILETSRERNKAIGVTGCLVFHKFSFVQIIEGEKSHIQSLFRDIRRDKRHRDVTLLWEGKNSGRNFGDWNMAYFTDTKENSVSGEMKNFERNLLLLSELSADSTAALDMFWIGVRKLISREVN